MTCPSNHWNDGNDVCADCGEDLNPPVIYRTLYYVSPTVDQLQWDEDGPVDRSLFVWATDASEAVKLWRDYYELGDEYGDDDEPVTREMLGVDSRVRVHEVPIMPAGAPSVAIGWGDIHSFGATVTERSEI